MNLYKWPALLGLALTTVYLSYTTDSTFAFDKPVHTAIAIFLTSGLAVLVASTLVHRPAQNEDKELARSEPILYPPISPSARRPSHPVTNFFDELNVQETWRTSPISFVFLTASLITRASLSHGIRHNVECAQPTFEPLLPLAFSFLHAFTLRPNSDPEKDSSSPDGALSRSRGLRSSLSVALTCIGALVALRSFGPPRSTHICPTSTPFIWAIPLLQHFTIVLDIVILYCITYILGTDRKHSSALQIKIGLRAISASLLISAAGLLAFGAVYYYITPNDRLWILDLSRIYLWDLLILSVIYTTWLICALFSLLNIGSLTLSLTLLWLFTIPVSTTNAWSTVRYYAATAATPGFVAITTAVIAYAGFLHLSTLSQTLSQAMPQRPFSRTSPLFYLLTATILILHTYLWISHNSTTSYHPIDVLMWDAEGHHNLFLNQSKTSTTLQEAVDHYYTRYGRYPPPNFDVWYRYATSRNSVIIDDFDSINNDLLPFFALEPAQIRQRTRALIVHPENDIGSVSIRDGKAYIGPHVPPTHRWMMEGVVNMIEKFSKHLPDMDLAFNINDEPRVAVAFERINYLRDLALSHDPSPQLTAHFQPGRREHWPRLPEQPTGEIVVEDASMENIFHSWGSIGCPPNSPARTKRLWNKRSTCIDCAAPHSLRGFIANYSLAGDVCHQPDLQDLAGIYISPAAFGATHKLYPIFSQGKPGGFNDILYPSAWLYQDKTAYAPDKTHEDPEWSKKIPDLFWRGGTTDGLSTGLLQWTGMLRQRFVHLINNIKNTSPPSYIPIQTSVDPRSYTFESIPSKDLNSALKTDVQIFEDISRCGGDDCARQRWEFAPTPKSTDFQSHWQHKYLLDLDGAGFSGRFLPFLHSRSLPFKSGVFREWWEDRVTPWLHFVPLDVRGQGFWGTLSYFAGLNGTINGRPVQIAARETEAEKIATAGRYWADRALRKEDMEIYMFRLLLEWARMTDDWRDEIGFSGSSGTL